jgi:hypothetical protein
MVITIKTEIPNEHIIDMLITAFEGGSNYWCLPESYQPSTWGAQIKSGRIRVKVYDREDEDDLLGTITEHSIRKGIILMMEDYPNAYSRWMTGDYDALDADIFLQLVTMGKVVFA